MFIIEATGLLINIILGQKWTPGPSPPSYNASVSITSVKGFIEQA
jgi:hypothetical protein